jgi:hypothetical protein
MDQVEKYLNLPRIKQALGFDDDFVFEAVTGEFNSLWGDSPASTVPSTREITDLLDRKKTRVLVVNGNNDGGL